MDLSQRTALLETALTRNLQWVNAAQSRIALVLPLATAMLGLLAALVPKTGAPWNVAAAVFSTLAALLLVASLVMVVLASFPRTSGPKGSLIYFAGISSRDLTQYEEAILSLSEENYLADLAKQCHRNAQIAERKFAWVQRGMACLFGSLAPWALAVWLLYQRSI